MAIKIYEMPGCISCRLKFTLGKAEPFEAYFDGGIPDKNYPAVYAARSIGQQLAIESSDMYKNGKIKLRGGQSAHAVVVSTSNKKSIKAPSEEAAVKELTEEAEAAPEFGVKSYPEVATLVDAIGVLKSEYGVSATRLKSEASVLRVADEKGVSFPNLKL